jgi:hypothetical protein
VALALAAGRWQRHGQLDEAVAGYYY